MDEDTGQWRGVRSSIYKYNRCDENVEVIIVESTIFTQSVASYEE